jgi:hypothetical protein
MKILQIVPLVAFLLLASCKKDDNSEAIESIAGHWHVLSFEPDNSSEIALIAKDVITQLEQLGCDPIEFSFKTDGKASSTNRLSLLNATTNEGMTEVDCVWEGGFRSGTFDFDYATLTLNFDDETLIYKAALEGEFLTILMDDMVLNGETVSGKLFFKRETGD